MSRSLRRCTALHAAALVFVASLLIHRSARADEPGSELSIALLTMGPGDHPFTKFGHDALLVRDARIGVDRVYNYGTFAFDSPWLIVDFLRGRFRYWLSVGSLEGVIEQYGAENRAAVAQELDLSPAERRRMADFLAANARGAAKYYKYDYYRDNCATRVRDAIDRAVGGRLHEVTRGPGRLTFRQHTLRLTAEDPLLYLGLDVAMGDLIDQPITTWEEMFLPAKVAESVRLVMLPGASGEPLHPLVKSEYVLVGAHRAPVRQAPPSWTLALLGVGTGVGSAFAVLGALAARGRAARIALGTSLGAIGLVLGTLGCVITGLWAFTDHQVTYRNENLLECAPFALSFVWLGFAVARGDVRRTATARAVATAAAGASAFGLVIKVLPMFDQNNLEIIALLLPVWLGVALGLRLANGDRRGSIA